MRTSSINLAIGAAFAVARVGDAWTPETRECSPATAMGYTSVSSSRARRWRTVAYVPGDLFDSGVGRPHHTGYVVESIEATAQRLADQFGAGPFILIEDVPLEDVTSRGEPAQFEHNSAFGSYGGYPIELLEVARAAPERVEARLSGPLPRIHHVGYVLARSAADAARAGFEERGIDAYLSSRLNGEYTTVHDASATLGHDIEILVDGEAFRAFFEMVQGAAEGWDGSDPLRPPG